MLEEHDERSRRCPRLGHEVTFHYCRTQEGSSLCGRILDCWWEAFDVRAFVAEHFGPEKVEELLDREHPNKVMSILDIVQQVQQRAARDRESSQ